MTDPNASTNINADTSCSRKWRAELVLAEIADGIICIDEDGCIGLFNRAAESMLSADAATLVGKTVESADLHAELKRLVAECRKSGDAVTSEILPPGLPERIIGVRASPFPETERAQGVLLLLHDLSEIRRHERLQKEFISNISHELRTPITAVRVTAETLLAGAKNDEEVVDRFLNTILAESDRLAALITDLMEIGRRESGVNKIEPCEVDIGLTIEQACVTIMPLAELNHVEVSFDLSDDLVGFVDETQIIQLMRNLVDNAVKYTPPGGRVDVSAAGRAGEIIITVADTGIGIPKGEVGRIFDRFYRVDKARSQRIGGTGLGLTIVKDIVEAHEGEIGVETELGKGSVFKVTLPSGRGS